MLDIVTGHDRQQVVMRTIDVESALKYYGNVVEFYETFNKLQRQK